MMAVTRLQLGSSPVAVPPPAFQPGGVGFGVCCALCFAACFCSVGPRCAAFVRQTACLAGVGAGVAGVGGCPCLTLPSLAACPLRGSVVAACRALLAV
jgi:hypothetical protein